MVAIFKFNFGLLQDIPWMTQTSLKYKITTIYFTVKIKYSFKHWTKCIFCWYITILLNICQRKIEIFNKNTQFSTNEAIRCIFWITAKSYPKFYFWPWGIPVFLYEHFIMIKRTKNLERKLSFSECWAKVRHTYYILLCCACGAAECLRVMSSKTLLPKIICSAHVAHRMNESQCVLIRHVRSRSVVILFF